MSESGEHRGVLYNPADYIGFWKRVVITLIDLVTILLVWILVYLLLGLIPRAGAILADESNGGYIMVALLLLIAFGYLVFLKRRPQGTFGYRLFRARIVNLKGDRPTIWQMMQRFAFLFIGPFNYMFDVLWITSDATKQALRDKWAGTYVIRADARPESTGPIVGVSYDILAVRMLIEEVEEKRPPLET